MAEILHHHGCQPNFEIMGVAGGSIKDAIMHDMAGGAGFQPSTVVAKAHQTDSSRQIAMTAIATQQHQPSNPIEKLQWKRFTFDFGFDQLVVKNPAIS